MDATRKRRSKKLTRQYLIDVLNGCEHKNGIDNGNGNGEHLTFGQRVADRVASVGGSWGFILSFMMFLLVWVAVNTVHVFWAPFDPYPFILLNLILSCLAAIQAPIIMMSQNRLDAKDREMARRGLKIDIKTARDIEMLNQKLDHLMEVLDADGEEAKDGYG